MGVRGYLEVYTQSDGWIDIALYDPNDFSYSPIEIWTPNGWATPYLRDPADANTPIECFTQSNGWMGINQTGWEYIEDFETGNLSRWYVSTDRTSVSTSASIINDYGAALADEQDQSTYPQRIYSHPNEGMTSLPYYPQTGDKFEGFVRFSTGSEGNGHHRIAFGVADQNVSNYFGPISSQFSEDFDNWLAVDMQSAISELHIWKKINGTRTERTTATFNPSAGTDYRVVIDWCHSSTDTISVDIYEYNPGGSDTHVASTSDTHSDYTTSRRGVFLESEAATDETDYDALRKYPGT